MNVLKCELCGSGEFVKEGDMFVCQYCHTKYSLAEAKKLLVEGTVKIDESDKIANLYERARKSLEIGDMKRASEYYKEILDRNPKDWEAYFYTYLGENDKFTNGEAAGVAQKLGRTLPNAYDMAIVDCTPEEAANRIKTITDHSVMQLAGIASVAYNLVSEYEGKNPFTVEGKVAVNLYTGIRKTAINTIVAVTDAMDVLDQKIGVLRATRGDLDQAVIDQCRLNVRRMRYTIANHDYHVSSLVTEKYIDPEYLKEYAQAIAELDPSFAMPTKKQLNPQKAKTKKTLLIIGCVIGLIFLVAAICVIIIVLGNA